MNALSARITSDEKNFNARVQGFVSVSAVLAPSYIIISQPFSCKSGQTLNIKSIDYRHFYYLVDAGAGTEIQSPVITYNVSRFAFGLSASDINESSTADNINRFLAYTSSSYFIGSAPDGVTNNSNICMSDHPFSESLSFSGQIIKDVMFFSFYGGFINRTLAASILSIQTLYPGLAVTALQHQVYFNINGFFS